MGIVIMNCLCVLPGGEIKAAVGGEVKILDNFFGNVNLFCMFEHSYLVTYVAWGLMHTRGKPVLGIR